MKVTDLFENDDNVIEGEKCNDCGNTLYSNYKDPTEYICTNCSKPQGWTKPAPARLVTTAAMKKNAKQNVSQVIAIIDPKDFIKVTTSNPQQIYDTAKTLDEYNQWAEEGEISVMPYLAIDLDQKKITGHEGRHRSAALVNAGGKEMFVAIVMRTADKEKYDITWDDLPRSIDAQHGTERLWKFDLQPVVKEWSR